MKLNQISGLILFGILASAATVANADLITSDTIVAPTVIDFSNQPTVVGVTGPIQIGDDVGMDVTAATITGSDDLSTNFDGWGLPTNGSWGAPMTYVSSQSEEGIRIAFNDGPVSQVGGFINDANRDIYADLIIRALDSGLNVLEEHNIDSAAPISTPDGYNEGAFRGIVRPSADIAYFEITGESPVLDDLTFSSTAVSTAPVPFSPLALLILTMLLGAVGFMRLKQNGLA